TGPSVRPTSPLTNSIFVPGAITPAMVGAEICAGGGSALPRCANVVAAASNALAIPMMWPLKVIKSPQLCRGAYSTFYEEVAKRRGGRVDPPAHYPFKAVPSDCAWTRRAPPSRVLA